MSRSLGSAILAAALPLITPSHTEVNTLEVRDAGGDRIRMVIAVLSGSAEDPAGKEGVAALAARALAPMAAGTSVWVDKNATRFACDAPAADFETACGPLIDAMGRRVLDPGRIGEERARMLEALDGLRASSEVIVEVFDALAFRGGPRAHPAAGTTAGLSTVTADDLSAFVLAHYRKGNVVTGLSGPTSAQVMSRVREGLAPLPDGPPQRRRPALSYLTRPRVLLVEQPGASPRGLAGVPLPFGRTHPDYLPLLSAMNPAGGAAWLRDRHAFVEELPMSTAAPSELESQLARLAARLRQGPDAAAIEKTQELAPEGGDAHARLLDQLLDIQWRTPGFRDRLPASLRAISPERVRATLNKHVLPERLAVVVLVPEAAQFLGQIRDDPAGFLSRDDYETVKASDLFR